MTNDQQCKIIGLTGPVGAGKDKVAKILRRCGAFVIDADEVAHTLYGRQSPVWQELVKKFGSKILRRGGEVNRKKLGEVVFSDKRKLQELNRIVHPYLRQAIIQSLESSKPLAVSRKQITVINAALPQLFEGMVDEVWVVMASQKIRLKRLLKTGLSKNEASSRMQLQISQREYFKLADVVIDNNGSFKQLKAKVEEILESC